MSLDLFLSPEALFLPPPDILEVIGMDDNPSWRSETSSRTYAMIPRPTSQHAVRCFFSGLTRQVASFYYMGVEGGERVDGSTIYSVGGEMIRNGLEHGPPNQVVVYGLFMGEQGICHGVSDGGDFFKRSDIKQCFESRQSFLERDLIGGPRTLGMESVGCGVAGGIYGGSDLIRVDTVVGVLYCVQYKNKLILPEEDKG